MGKKADFNDPIYLLYWCLKNNIQLNLPGARISLPEELDKKSSKWREKVIRKTSRYLRIEHPSFFCMPKSDMNKAIVKFIDSEHFKKRTCKHSATHVNAFEFYFGYKEDDFLGPERRDWKAPGRLNEWKGIEYLLSAPSDKKEESIFKIIFNQSSSERLERAREFSQSMNDLISNLYSCLKNKDMHRGAFIKTLIDGFYIKHNISIKDFHEKYLRMKKDEDKKNEAVKSPQLMSTVYAGKRLFADLMGFIKEKNIKKEKISGLMNYLDYYSSLYTSVIHPNDMVLNVVLEEKPLLLERNLKNERDNFCVFPGGKCSEASVAYALDKNAIILSVFLNDKRMDSEPYFNYGLEGRIISAFVNESGKKKLLVDGVLLSQNLIKYIEGIRKFSYKKSPANNWKDIMLYSIAKFAKSKKMEGLLINMDHSSSLNQKEIQDFSDYCLNNFSDGVEKKTSPDFPNFEFTHWVHKERAEQKAINAMEYGKRFSDYHGEGYFDSSYSWNKWISGNYDSLSDKIRRITHVRQRHERDLKYSEEIKKVEQKFIDKKMKGHTIKRKKYEIRRRYYDPQWNQCSGPINAIELNADEIISRLKGYYPMIE